MLDDPAAFHIAELRPYPFVHLGKEVAPLFEWPRRLAEPFITASTKATRTLGAVYYR